MASSYQIFLFLITFFNIFVYSTSSSQLYDSYVYFSEDKIHYKFHKNAMNWYDAKITCEDENAKLAIPRNIKESSRLKDIFKTYSKDEIIDATNFKFIFLNFHDLFYEGEYLSENGFNIQYYYHKWSDGEPNNENGDENCGAMNGFGKLNDYYCYYKLAFICQKEDEPFNKKLLEKRNFNTDPGYRYEPTSQKYFKLHLDPKPWAQARTICHAENGNLAFIGSKQEEDFLVNMFNDPDNKVPYAEHKEYVYLGFHDMFREGKFYTVQGVHFDALNYIRWHTGQPDNHGGKENCGAMHSSGGLSDVVCSKSAVFFCEQSAVNSNPQIDIRFIEE